MSIKNCKIADGDVAVDSEILYHLVRVFHAVSLTYIGHHSCIESLCVELKKSNPEGVIRPQLILLVGLELPVHATRTLAIEL